MTEFPMVSVLFTTYNRTPYAVRAIQTALENLIYPNLVWYIADSGSRSEHLDVIQKLLSSSKVIGFHSDGFLLPGNNWNKGIRRIFDFTNIYFRLEDDWITMQKVDLAPYVKVLLEQEEVGQVRLGGLPINIESESVGYDGRTYLRLHKTREYYYSGHPGLIHKRFHDAYGYFDNDEPVPGNCEIFLDANVLTTPGPAAWWPVDNGTWGPFGHIGTERTEDMK